MGRKLTEKQQKKKELEEMLDKVKSQGMKAVGLWRQSHTDILTPEEFYDKLFKPVNSKAAEFFTSLTQEGNKTEIDPSSRLVVYDLKTNHWKWQKIANKEELLKAVKASEGAAGKIQNLREQKTTEYLAKQRKAKEFSDGSATVPSNNNNISGYEIKHEYTPLLGTPFFKQMYLYDYLLMHSKTFWYKNYSGPAKLIISIFHSFILGDGFSETIDDEKAKKAWIAYKERTHLDEKVGVWLEELLMSGEIMLEKKLRPDGICHVSIDPSTVWEIVTDPENIEDIKYYHQQYPTQYQMYGDKNTPMSKYILRQIPPELVHHKKINVTTWEKRGRSELLAALLYLKYFDDYIGFKLQRTKAEAAYFWDVMIKGDAADVANYISTTQSMVDVAPGSENVHNEAVSRTPIQPSLSHVGSDDVAKWIISYIGMSVGLPASYFGTFEQQGASRASALVATEPVTKLMERRRSLIEGLLGDIFKDVMIAEGCDPKTKVEFNFPELIVEDRSKKLQDMVLAYEKGIISHKTMSDVVAKELNITSYDYDEEMAEIEKFELDSANLTDPEPDDSDLTKKKTDDDTKGGTGFDREKARDQTKQKL